MPGICAHPSSYDMPKLLAAVEPGLLVLTGQDLVVISFHPASRPLVTAKLRSTPLRPAFSYSPQNDIMLCLDIFMVKVNSDTFIIYGCTESPNTCRMKKAETGKNESPSS